MTHLAGSAKSTPVRVLGWPAFSHRPVNPYTALLYDSILREGLHVTEFRPLKAVIGRTDVLHLHWPDALIDRRSWVGATARALALLLLMTVVRARGGKTVWTVHNIASHDAFHRRLEKWFWPQFIARLSGYIALSEYGRTVAQERFPPLCQLPGFVVPHGDYRAEYPRGVDRSDARKQLGIDGEARVVLFFGRVRPYKGVMELIQAFSQLDGSDLVLCVAGSPSPERFGERVSHASEQDPRVQAHLRFVPREEAQVFFAAADLVVLPYAEILNSGSAMLALSFDRPVLLPRRGALVELEEEVGARWVRTFGGDLAPETLESAISWALSAERESVAPLEPYGWEEIGRRTATLYRQVLERGRVSDVDG